MDSGIECDSEGLPFECEEEPEEKIELTEEEKLEAEAKKKRERILNIVSNCICAAVFIGVLIYCLWTLLK